MLLEALDGDALARNELKARHVIIHTDFFLQFDEVLTALIAARQNVKIKRWGVVYVTEHLQHCVGRLYTIRENGHDPLHEGGDHDKGGDHEMFITLQDAYEILQRADASSSGHALGADVEAPPG